MNTTFTDEEKLEYAGMDYLRSGVKEPETVYDLYVNNYPFLYLPENLRLANNVIYFSIRDSWNVDWNHASTLINQFPKLKKLYLVSNNFEVVPFSASKLTGLEELLIENNRNLHIERAMSEISKLKSLKKLALFTLPYSQLPDEVLNLQNLEEIWIGANDSLDYEQHFKILKKMKKLQALTIVEFQHSRLPKGLGELRLKELTLEDCKKLDYEQVFNDVGNFDSLTFLRIRGTELEYLPENIRRFENLKTLKLIENRQLNFDSLSEDLTFLTNLEELNLDASDANPPHKPASPHRLPEGIATLKNLKTLILDNLSYLDLYHGIDLMKKLPVLEKLSLEYISDYEYGGNVFVLPSSFSELTTLEKLNLNLTGPYTFDSLTTLPPNLTHLSKNESALEVFPPLILELKHLKSLRLKENRLTEIPPEISRLKNLVHLDLSKNKLEDLPDEIAELKNLRFLQISENPLSEDEEKQERIRKLLPNTVISFYY
ncbi:hypothetical protein GCM10009122_53500 [Fulvivirga kasyanovii]